MEEKSVLQCEMCEKKIGGGGSKQMFILGAFHLDKSHELKFCSRECMQDFLDVDDEFESEGEEDQEEEEQEKSEE